MNSPINIKNSDQCGPPAEPHDKRGEERENIRHRDARIAAQGIVHAEKLGSIPVPPQKKSGADYAPTPCGSQTLDLSDYYVREQQRKYKAE